MRENKGLFISFECFKISEISESNTVIYVETFEVLEYSAMRLPVNFSTLLDPYDKVFKSQKK